MQAYELKVKWLGLKNIEDSCEPMDNVTADVHLLVKRYAFLGLTDNLYYYFILIKIEDIKIRI